MNRIMALSAPGKPPRFACYIDGDSMEPKFPNGSIVIFRTVDEPVEGKAHYLYLANEENTFKRVYADPRRKSQLVLRPDNPKYREGTIPRESIIVLAVAERIVTAVEGLA